MKLGRRTATVVALALAGAGLAAPAAADAAIIAPNTTADQFNTDVGSCSLREAVWAADHNSTASAPGCTAGDAATDTIQLAPGTYELTIPQSGVGEDVASGDLQFNGGLIVEAIGSGPVTIDANQTDRIFQVFFGPLTIDGVTLTGGFVDASGEGSASTGGAIATSGGVQVTLTDSAVVGNRSDGFGGGIAVPGGTLSMTNVTVSGNTATEHGGGGVEISGGGTLVLEHVTVTDNVGVAGGSDAGGFAAGGVLLSGAVTTSVHNSIIAGNSENSSVEDVPNCEGAFASGGGNVIGVVGECGFPAGATGDELDVADPGLAPLGDYGGPSLTHAVNPGSTAIGNGVPICPPSDQRGVARLAPCEAGAYEVLAGDSDGDNVLDGADNCPNTVNARQENLDGDAEGDACDLDDDGDGAADVGDNCPTVANPDQANADGDAQGNACDADDDNDSVLDVSDACPIQVGIAANAGCPAPATADNRCAELRAKLKKAKKAGKRTKVRKIRKKLRKLGC